MTLNIGCFFLIIRFAILDPDEGEKDQMRDMEEFGDFQDPVFRLVRVVRIADPADHGPAQGRLEGPSQGSEIMTVVFD